MATRIFRLSVCHGNAISPPTRPWRRLEPGQPVATEGRARQTFQGASTRFRGPSPLRPVAGRRARPRNPSPGAHQRVVTNMSQLAPNVTAYPAPPWGRHGTGHRISSSCEAIRPIDRQNPAEPWSARVGTRRLLPRGERRSRIRAGLTNQMPLDLAPRRRNRSASGAHGTGCISCLFLGNTDYYLISLTECLWILLHSESLRPGAVPLEQP